MSDRDQLCLSTSVATTADAAVVNCVGHLPKMPRRSTVSGLGSGKGGSHESSQPLQPDSSDFCVAVESRGEGGHVHRIVPVSQSYW